MSDEWYTPSWIFETMALQFDLDVAAPKTGSPWVGASSFYSIEDDGLAQPWSGKVWMNPPYSKPSPWVEKWLNHGNGIALLPMSKSKWFNHLMQSEAKFVMLPWNLNFINVQNKPLKLMMASTLWALGDENIETLSKFGKVR